MLIDEYDIEFGTPDCQHPSCDELFAKLSVKTDISGLLPYVNAVVGRGEYTPDLPVLVWIHGGHKYALRPHEVAISSLDGRENGLEEVRRTVEWLNGIWDMRDEIAPDYTARAKPKVLDVFKLLPCTNCKKCGLPSCMGFAGELVAGNKSLDDCTPLLDETNQEARQKLLEMGL